jgi:hypothetical protein
LDSREDLDVPRLAKLIAATSSARAKGMIITLRRSKTDQDGAGPKIGVPVGRPKWCPPTTLDRWLQAARIEDGPKFRPIDRHGRVSRESLPADAVCLVV